MAKNPKRGEPTPDYRQANAEAQYRMAGALSGLPKLPASWGAPNYRPDGSKPCDACDGREWWGDAKGWRCVTCHPPVTKAAQAAERAPARQEDAA